MKRQPTIDQLRQRLERAKERGRIDEIRAAAGALGGAASAARAAERRQARERTQRAERAASTALGAVAQAQAQLERLPAVAPSVDRAAAGRRGAAVRRLRLAEQRALAAVVERQRLQQAAPPAPPAGRAQRDDSAGPSGGRLTPEDAVRLRRAAYLLAALVKLQPGQAAFKGFYMIVEPGEGDYHYGVAVRWAPDGIEYRWTGRALRRENAKTDLQALKRSYGRSQPPASDMVQPQQWPQQRQRRREPDFGSYEEAEQLAAAGRDFDLLVSMVRA